MTVWHGPGKQDYYKAPGPPYPGIKDLPGGYHPVFGQFQLGLETATEDQKHCCIYTSEEGK